MSDNQVRAELECFGLIVDSSKKVKLTARGRATQELGEVDATIEELDLLDGAEPNGNCGAGRDVGGRTRRRGLTGEEDHYEATEEEEAEAKVWLAGLDQLNNCLGPGKPVKLAVVAKYDSSSAKVVPSKTFT